MGMQPVLLTNRCSYWWPALNRELSNSITFTLIPLLQLKKLYRVSTYCLTLLGHLIALQSRTCIIGRQLQRHTQPALIVTLLIDGVQEAWNNISEIDILHLYERIHEIIHDWIQNFGSYFGYSYRSILHLKWIFSRVNYLWSRIFNQLNTLPRQMYCQTFTIIVSSTIFYNNCFFVFGTLIQSFYF